MRKIIQLLLIILMSIQTGQEICGDTDGETRGYFHPTECFDGDPADHVGICENQENASHEACLNGQLKPIKVHLHNIVRLPPYFEYSPQYVYNKYKSRFEIESFETN